MAVSLAGKTAIVTGAGSGINLAFARSLLNRQCNVLFADLALRPEAEEVVSQHSSSSRAPAKALFQQTDVREWNQLERMFTVAEKELGEVDVVCPGAGVYEPTWSSFWHPPGRAPSIDKPESNNYSSLLINLLHPIRTTQIALSRFLSSPPPRRPTLIAQPTTRPPKSIIHISSIAGQATPFPPLLYSVAKHGINALVHSLAPLGKDPHINVRVTGVAPGVIKTPLWTDHPDKMRLLGEADEWVSANVVAEVMRRLVEEDEVEVDAIADSAAVTSGKKMVKVEGGMILEVAARGRVRVVGQFNDPGPSGVGNTVGNMDMATGEILSELKKGGWGIR